MNRRLQVLAADRALALAASPAGCAAAEEGEIPLLHSGTDINDVESLQRGARNFMNYCSGCHSLTYVRYNRMAQDLKIPEADLAEPHVHLGRRSFDGINSAMPADDAAEWFGKAPPDLSLIARERGVDYLYSYLKGYYVDNTRPWGVNNLYLPNAAMPDVLASLQGLQKPVYQERAGRGRQRAHGAGRRRDDVAGRLVAAGV